VQPELLVDDEVLVEVLVEVVLEDVEVEVLLVLVLVDVLVEVLVEVLLVELSPPVPLDEVEPPVPTIGPSSPSSPRSPRTISSAPEMMLQAPSVTTLTSATPQVHPLRRRLVCPSGPDIATLVVVELLGMFGQLADSVLIK